MRLKIVFIAPLPPPVTGQSVACALLHNSIKTRSVVSLININKKTFNQGLNSFSRMSEVANILFSVIKRKESVDLIYFTVSESIAGNLRDVIIYAILWKYLDRMTVHLHGGEGMRVIMSDKHPVLRALNVFFLKRLGAVVVLGDRLKSIYTHVVPSERLHVVKNFANDEFFVSPAEIDAKFASTEPLRLLFLSNLLPGKGHMELLAALSRLPAELRDRLHVDFAGGFESPEDEVQFRREVQTIQGIQIHVHGVVQGEWKRGLLGKAHLFCLPTYYPYEGQPISILEAYASGCAVLTTDHSGIFDTFTPGINGYEVKPRNPDSIVKALQHVLEHPEELCNFARTNRNYAEQKYRASAHLENLEKIIFSVAKQDLNGH